MPCRAGVSSFSLGGINAHVVLEQPPSGRPRRRPAAPGTALAGDLIRAGHDA
ncbi:hypothetical protein [Streptomyces sp. Rer75]|uniref:hypothetical protein n=2 Tax=unclassified Streptomyces TaxID=2593676 RepID=UPI00211E52F1|nr:hypothetical protein [Streptomyces sp. Rer75]